MLPGCWYAGGRASKSGKRDNESLAKLLRTDKIENRPDRRILSTRKDELTGGTPTTPYILDSWVRMKGYDRLFLGILETILG